MAFGILAVIFYCATDFKDRFYLAVFVVSTAVSAALSSITPSF